jgi:hypothetical protein
MAARAAALRQQHNLAGAGNIIAWGRGSEVASSGEGKDAGDAAVADPAAAAREEAARELAAAAAAEIARVSAAARADVGRDHAVFCRLLIHRLTEARTLLANWCLRVAHTHSSGASSDEPLLEDDSADDDDAAGSPALEVSACFRAPAFHASRAAVLPLLRVLGHLRHAAHESVAVDVLHALHGCAGTFEHAGCRVEVVGGIPVWSWRCADVRWLPSLVAVVETLLYSPYEDYVTVALRTCQFLVEATAPLCTFLQGITTADLVAPEEGDGSRDGSGSDEGAAGDGPHTAAAVAAAAGDALTGPSDGRLRHAVACVCSPLQRALSPLSVALEHCARAPASVGAGAGGSGSRSGGTGSGRVMKLAASRLAGVGDLVAALRLAATRPPPSAE